MFVKRGKCVKCVTDGKGTSLRMCRGITMVSKPLSCILYHLRLTPPPRLCRELFNPLLINARNGLAGEPDVVTEALLQPFIGERGPNWQCIWHGSGLAYGPDALALVRLPAHARVSLRGCVDNLMDGSGCDE